VVLRFKTTFLRTNDERYLIQLINFSD